MKSLSIFPLFKFFASRVPRPAFIIMVSILLLMMTSACGKKGPVRPKLISLPMASEDVSLQQQGNLFLLSWAIPDKNEDGSKAEDLIGFRVKRLVFNATEACPTCRDPQVEVAKLDLDFPAPGQRLGDRMFWRDTAIDLNSGYRYAIHPLTVGGIECQAAMTHLVAKTPPPAPTSLQVEAGDTQVSLSWQAPELPQELELVGYNLYRRQAQRPFPAVPVNAKPLTETTLVDRGLDNGRAYEYRVSALVRNTSGLIESMATPGALITPQAGR